jgi:TPR repeat protein
MRRAAEAGYAPAQSHLGGILLTSPYRVEPGIPPNDTEALKWLRQATAQNDFNGLTTLSECYLEGRAVPKDYAEGVRLLRKALDCSGLPYSSYYPDKLSKLYQEGKGVPKDLTLAYMWKLIALAAWKDDDSGRAAAQATSEELEASLTRSELLAAQGHATKWWEERIR